MHNHARMRLSKRWMCLFVRETANGITGWSWSVAGDKSSTLICQERVPVSFNIASSKLGAINTWTESVAWKNYTQEVP